MAPAQLLSTPQLCASLRTVSAARAQPKAVSKLSFLPQAAQTHRLLGRRARCIASAASPAEGIDKSTGVTSAAPPPFHLAFPVHDLAAAREFYGEKLGLQEGRSSQTWVDYSLFSHQIVCHHVAGYAARNSANAVDGDAVPVPHFGLVLSIPQFHEFAEKVKDAGVHFIIEPHLRFKGQPGEQYTMFFQDPSGNSLEFKAMANPDNLFAKYTHVES